MKKLRQFTAIILAGGTLTGLCPAAEPAPAAPAINQLSAAEKLEGWQLLFDGATFTGWRGYGLPGLPAAGWEIQEGMIKTVPNVRGTELITERKFDDFELSWEWRLAEGGNNGIKYFVTEARRTAPGHEYQMIDDARHPDGRRGPLYQTGAFYDVLVPAEGKPLRAPGEWNLSRIIVRGKSVEHWLNGRKVLAYETGSAEVLAGVARSKFKNEAGFGEKITGHLMLTYHNDACWFRNLKVRALK